MSKFQILTKLSCLFISVDVMLEIAIRLGAFVVISIILVALDFTNGLSQT